MYKDDAYELRRLQILKNKFNMYIIIYGITFTILIAIKLIDYFIPFLPLF